MLIASFKRSISSRWLLAHILLVCFSLCSAVHGGELISPDSQRLQFSTLLPHEGSASSVLISRDGQTVYLIESDAKAGRGKVVVANITPFLIKSQIEIEHTITSAVVDPEKAGRLFLSGNAGENRAITMVVPEQHETGSYLTYASRGVTVLAPDHSGGVCVGDSTTGSILRLSPADFLPRPSALEARNRRKVEDFAFQISGIGGVNGMSMSKDDSVLFVSDSVRPQIVAVSLEKPGAELSRIGSPSAKQGELPPFNFAFASRPSRRAKSGEVSSLYIADMQQRRLQLVDYNEIVSAFDGIADASLVGQAKQQSGLTGPGTLIGVDDGQTAILIGDGQEASLDLFSRSGSTLQQLLAIGLPDVPQNVNLSADGKRALVLLRGGKVALLDTDISVSPTVPINNKTIGTETVRDIQYTLDRLGFRVGAIDGMAGSRTKAATRDAIAKLGLDPTLSLEKPQDLLDGLKLKLNELKNAN
jgi:hypothetical protein